MNNFTIESVLTSPLVQVPNSTLIMPESSCQNDKQKNNLRPKNLRLFTGIKPHQQQVAKKFRQIVDDQPCRVQKEVKDNFNAPPLLKQIIKVKPLENELKSNKLDDKNTAISISTEETSQFNSSIIQDDIGECCSADEINQIDQHDILEQKIHKWLDEEHIYITDPREKRDYFYQKLKLLSYKISQQQTSIQLQNEEEKTSRGSNETIESSFNLIGLSSQSIPQSTLNDLSMHLNLKIENSPLLMRRNSNTHAKKNKQRDQEPTIQQSQGTFAQINSPVITKSQKKSSIFRSSDLKKLCFPSLDIKVIPFAEDELEEIEKKGPQTMQEMSSVSLDISEMSSIIICDSNQNYGF